MPAMSLDFFDIFNCFKTKSWPLAPILTICIGRLPASFAPPYSQDHFLIQQLCEGCYLFQKTSFKLLAVHCRKKIQLKISLADIPFSKLGNMHKKCSFPWHIVLFSSLYPPYRSRQLCTKNDVIKLCSRVRLPLASSIRSDMELRFSIVPKSWIISSIFRFVN